MGFSFLEMATKSVIPKQVRKNHLDPCLSSPHLIDENIPYKKNTKLGWLIDFPIYAKKINPL